MTTKSLSHHYMILYNLSLILPTLVHVTVSAVSSSHLLPVYDSTFLTMGVVIFLKIVGVGISMLNTNF